MYQEAIDLLDTQHSEGRINMMVLVNCCTLLGEINRKNIGIEYTLRPYHSGVNIDFSPTDLDYDTGTGLADAARVYKMKPSVSVSSSSINVGLEYLLAGISIAKVSNDSYSAINKVGGIFTKSVTTKFANTDNDGGALVRGLPRFLLPKTLISFPIPETNQALHDIIMDVIKTT